MPDYLPWPGRLVVISGMLEVATGVLILVPEARPWAARSSLVLLALLLPAMYEILYEPDALTWSPAANTLFRTLLLPHNILMAICSVYLIRSPATSLARPAATSEARIDGPSPWRLPGMADPVTLIVPFLLLIANCAGFLAIVVTVPGRMGGAFLWAMACIATGALIGFLFGVPRLNPRAQLSGEFIHNQNIEAVSDWLTKILVGVGLVNFQAIGAFTQRMAEELGRGIAVDRSIAMGLIVYFFAVGIIQGYILTRIFLAKPFQLRAQAAAAAAEEATVARVAARIAEDKKGS